MKPVNPVSTKTTKHIHDDPRIDCPACVEWIRSEPTKLIPLKPIEFPDYIKKFFRIRL